MSDWITKRFQHSDIDGDVVSASVVLIFETSAFHLIRQRLAVSSSGLRTIRLASSKSSQKCSLLLSTWLGIFHMSSSMVVVVPV